MSAIDWTRPSCPVTPRFNVGEALYLPRVKRWAGPGDGLNEHVEEQLERFFREVMEPARNILGRAILVHCAWRPDWYNKLVGGAKDSAHICRGDWAACDFSLDLGMGSAAANCDAARGILLGKLEWLGARMENKPLSEWVHLDNRPVPDGGHRFFTP